MRDHGGDLDRAKARFGTSDWIDLSTGINATPYPIDHIESLAFSTLPTNEDIATLERGAAGAYGTKASVVALGGAQAAIQLVPRLLAPGTAKVLVPTYNEHAAALKAQSWAVAEVKTLADLKCADIAIVVNPNNPDGQCWSPDELGALAETTGLLVVDESFADPHPERSLAPMLHRYGERVLVLRSFGKFYGLAGLRLGFALGGPKTIATLRALAGPWAVNGPAICVARRALADTLWQANTRERLKADAQRLDAWAATRGWALVGGTDLFRTYQTPDAPKAQSDLANAGIWTRIFPYSPTWLRMGLPGTKDHWARVEDALSRRGQ